MKQKDPAYEYFFKVLSDWVQGEKLRCQTPTKTLADKIGKDPGVISRYLNRKRIVPFDVQLAFAEELGYQYIEMLEEGRRRLGGGESVTMDNAKSNMTPLKQKHQDIISAFKDEELALKANQILVRLENIHRENFLKAINRIESILEDTEEIIKTSLPNRTGTHGGNQ